MPFTPFHLGILIFGLVFLNVFYVPALVISSTVMDAEPFYYYFISPNPDGSAHLFFHTYLGATIIAVIAGFVIVRKRKLFDNLLRRFKLNQGAPPNKLIYASSFFAAYSHIFVDSLMHADIKPFYPITSQNPFLGLIGVAEIYEITGALLLISLGAYILCARAKGGTQRT